MGYGGFFKKIFRIAVPIVVSMIPGMQPLGVALASAAATGITGGSFKEALMAGATSYIGAKVSANFGQAAKTGQLGGKIVEGSAHIGTTAAGVTQVIDSTTMSVLAEGSLADAAMSSATSQLNSTLASGAASGIGGAALGADPSFFSGGIDAIAGKAQDAVTGGISKFTEGATNTGFGGFTEGAITTMRTPFDVLQKLGDTVLSPGTANIIDAAGSGAASSLMSNPVGSLIGGATTFTLNQALLANTPEADDLLAQQGYSPQQIQLLKQEARNQLSQQKFDQLTDEQANPFLREGQTPEQLASAEEEFNKVIASGIERENTSLGPDITQQQFDAKFEDPNFGQSILDDELGLRQASFGSELGKTFTGDAFSGIDDDIINSIIEERKAPALQQVSKTQARGNLNTTGGQTANRFLEGQVGQAGERVRTAGSGVLSGNQAGVDAIRDTAREGISNYQLGDDLFDPSPFTEQRQGFIDERQGTLRDDLSTAVGSDPLFDVGGAINAGGRSGGLVSGGTGASPSFLDSIAARERGTLSGTTSKRGLGSRGSGTF